MIDECLSPGLVQLATDAGHVGLKDWELMEFVLKEDMTLVLSTRSISAAPDTEVQGVSMLRQKFMPA